MLSIRSIQQMYASSDEEDDEASPSNRSSVPTSNSSLFSSLTPPVSEQEPLPQGHLATQDFKQQSPPGHALHSSRQLGIGSWDEDKQGHGSRDEDDDVVWVSTTMAGSSAHHIGSQSQGIGSLESSPAPVKTIATAKSDSKALVHLNTLPTSESIGNFGVWGNSVQLTQKQTQALEAVRRRFQVQQTVPAESSTASISASSPDQSGSGSAINQPTPSPVSQLGSGSGRAFKVPPGTLGEAAWLAEQEHRCVHCSFKPEPAELRQATRSTCRHYEGVHGYAFTKQMMPRFTYIKDDWQVPETDYEVIDNFFRSSPQKQQLDAAMDAAIEGLSGEPATIKRLKIEAGVAWKQNHGYTQWLAVPENVKAQLRLKQEAAFQKMSQPRPRKRKSSSNPADMSAEGSSFHYDKQSVNATMGNTSFQAADNVASSSQGPMIGQGNSTANSTLTSESNGRSRRLAFTNEQVAEWAKMRAEDGMPWVDIAALAEVSATYVRSAVKNRIAT